MKKLALAIAFAAPIAPLAVHAAPALVQIGVGTCTMADGNGNFFTTSSPNVKIKVSTQSANQNLILNCHVDNVPNNTGREVFYNAANTGGGQCIINDPLRGVPRVADNWHEVVSAGGSSNSGNADLSCMTNTP